MLSADKRENPLSNDDFNDGWRENFYFRGKLSPVSFVFTSFVRDFMKVRGMLRVINQ